MLLLSTTRSPTSPLKSSFTGTNARAPPKQLSCITNRNHLTPSSTSARMKATPQTSLTLSTPIILSIGKPLKHSLMSTHSSPHVRPGVRLHHRAQSEPATPARGSVKNVLPVRNPLALYASLMHPESRSMDRSGRQRMTLKPRLSTIRPAFQKSLQASPSRSWVRAAASLTPPSNSIS